MTPDDAYAWDSLPAHPPPSSRRAPPRPPKSRPAAATRALVERRSGESLLEWEARKSNTSEAAT